MIVPNRHKGLTVLAVTLLAACTSPPKENTGPLVETPSPSDSASFNCPAETDWFPHSETPKPPFDDFESSSNCVFHQWSWQAFLWLTQDVDGKPRFLSFQSPADLFDESRIGTGMLPRMAKSAEPETINEYLQAGTDGILVDQNGRAVYYSQYLDSTFANFVTANNLTDPKTLAAFDANTPFVNGSLELKASWKIVQPGEDVSTYFSMPATVNLLANEGGRIVIDPDKTAKVTLALVGFHVAGRVNGHPEMIWATFEHIDNAPNVPAGATASTVVSENDWTFYKAGTTFGDCNQNPSSSPDLKLDEASQTLSPITQACRLYEFGNDPNDPVNDRQKIQTNDSNINDLNVQVRAKLEQDQKSSVWANYFEVGAIWFNTENALVPDDALATDELLTGSFKLSNATIETFTQTQSTENNCFRCHNTEQRFPPSLTMNPLPGKDVNISHIIVNGYFRAQE